MSSQLVDFLLTHRNILVLTGAGVSTASGIPDYRDESGDWKHRPPMEYREFVSQFAARQRYWARSFVGWQRFRQAQPNAAHRALARLENLDKLSQVITQNVDGLHQAAGSRRVIELHGSLESVVCLDCGHREPRPRFQNRLHEANPELSHLDAHSAPDGDARLEDYDTRSVDVPGCESCGGVVKPGVVFFGETLVPGSMQACNTALAGSDGLLVLGTSLMVFSGFRLVRDAVAAGLPVLLINQGKTRADELIDLRLRGDCGSLLSAALETLAPDAPNRDPVAM